MHISSAFNAPLSSGINNKPTTPIKHSQRSGEPVAETAAKIKQEQPSSKQAKASIVANEQAIALFEKNQVEQNQLEQSQASQLVQAHQDKNNASFDDSFNESSANKDQPSAKNETAVASYQAVGNLAQRESVQQLFGVDVFA